MKSIISLLSFIIVMAAVTTAAPNGKKKNADLPINNNVACAEIQQASEIKAYYFHATRRCATCEAVEEVSRAAITEYYGDKVPFESINREEDEDNPLLKKYKISGQTLLIVKGDKKIDLTNDAFLNARNNPNKLKKKIKSTIDSLM